MRIPTLSALERDPDPTLTVTVAGGLCRLRLNRPGRLNALTEPLRNALEMALLAVSHDSSVRVVCLSGSGPAFCSGMDRGEHDSPMTSPDPAARWQALEGWRRVLDGIEQLPQVSVASVRGPVIGGGLLLAVACDLRVAAPDAQLSAPEVLMGGVPAANGMQRLVREIGLPRARELLLTGRVVGAEQAAEWGLVTRVADDLDGETERLLDTLLAAPFDSLSRARRGLSAIGRAASAMELGWADADLMTASLRTAALGTAPPTP